MNLELSKVNEIIECFERVTPYYLSDGKISYREGCKYKLISTEEVEPFREEQGENGRTDYVFEISQDLYVKVICIGDSYGDYLYTTIRFVQPETKTVIYYEPV